MSLENKVALITGAGRGIGRAIAQLFAERGAKVVITSRTLAECEKTAQEIHDQTGAATLAKQVDVASFDSAKAMVESVLSEMGRIDILVNNAGVTRDNLIMRMDESDWDVVIDTNLKGTFNITKAIVRAMIRQRYGRIVNISSVSGLAGQVGQVNYSASKAGMIGFSKALAREVASRGITVNVVAPGYIPTALTNDLPADLKDAIIKMTPMGRMGTVEEVAHAAAFFASDEASYITGQVLSVDGGMVMM